MIIDVIKKVTEGIGDKARLMVGRCIIRAVNDKGGVQVLQAQLLADEFQDDVERIQQYGLTTVPLDKAEGVVVFVGGNRDHGLVIACEDRRYRLKGLAGGDVALYDFEGQSVQLRRGGKVLVKANTEITLDAPDTLVTGNLRVKGQVVGDKDIADQGGTKTMRAMRTAHNGHAHPNPEGGNVGLPTVDM